MYLADMITSSYSFSLRAFWSDVLVAFLSCSLVACRIKLPSISNQSIVSEFWHSFSSIWNKNALLFMFVISFRDQISKNGFWLHHYDISWCGCGQLQSVIRYLVFIGESTCIHTPLWPVSKCKLIVVKLLLESRLWKPIASLTAWWQTLHRFVRPSQELWQILWSSQFWSIWIHCNLRLHISRLMIY